MVCKSIFIVFLSCVFIAGFWSSSMEMYLYSWSDFKFYIVFFQKKNIIRKTSFLNYKSPCHPLKRFKLLIKIEELNKCRKNSSNFP